MMERSGLLTWLSTTQKRTSGPQWVISPKNGATMAWVLCPPTLWTSVDNPHFVLSFCILYEHFIPWACTLSITSFPSLLLDFPAALFPALMPLPYIDECLWSVNEYQLSCWCLYCILVSIIDKMWLVGLRPVRPPALHHFGKTWLSGQSVARIWRLKQYAVSCHSTPHHFLQFLLCG